MREEGPASLKDSRRPRKKRLVCARTTERKGESDAQTRFARREHAMKQRADPGGHVPSSWGTEERLLGVRLGLLPPGKHRRCLLGHRCVQPLEQHTAKQIPRRTACGGRSDDKDTETEPGSTGRGQCVRPG